MPKLNSQRGCAPPESAWPSVLVMKLFAEEGSPISKKARGTLFSCNESTLLTELGKVLQYGLHIAFSTGAAPRRFRVHFV